MRGLLALMNLLELKQYTVSLHLSVWLIVILVSGNETFSKRKKSSGSLLWLIWRENANMSNVKGG
jgi:hypothetical protein